MDSTSRGMHSTIKNHLSVFFKIHINTILGRCQGGMVDRAFKQGKMGFHHVMKSFVHSTIQPTRTEVDFLEHAKQTIAADTDADWIIVTDQLNTHMSESLVKFVAANCGIKCDLGVKGRRGILKRMSTRAEFLEDESHRIRFVYTPKHCSCC